MKRRLEDLPYYTNDGGAWLKKALDPAELAVEVVGMPDTNTNQRTILNYQMQADIPIPDSDTYVATQVSSYDANLYLYQDPIIFGMSVCYPSGTRNPQIEDLVFDFDSGIIRLAAGTAPRTVSVFMNNQIEGVSYEEKMDNFSKYCQRYRMIYGGVQGIPACSQMFDSGTIEATQQIFNPEASIANSFNSPDGILQTECDEMLETGNTEYSINTNPVQGLETTASSNKFHVSPLHLKKYKENDFPDSGQGIQNPSSLYCRYKQGVYMPYKIKNPLNHPYINSEERILQDAPYIMTGEIYWTTSDASTTKHWGCLQYNPESREFALGERTTNTGTKYKSSFSIKCYLKTGIPFWLTVYTESNDATNYLTSSSVKTFLGVPHTLPGYGIGSYLAEIVDTIATNQYRWWRIQAISAVLDPTRSDYYSFLPFETLPQPETNIGVINFKSIATQASIRLIFRLGFELMITAGGVYSPFKHGAPRFDQKAINSYIAASHLMRDAFYGDAATSAGHDDYSARILDLLGGNGGSGWYGSVGV